MRSSTIKGKFWFPGSTVTSTKMKRLSPESISRSEKLTPGVPSTLIRYMELLPPSSCIFEIEIAWSFWLYTLSNCVVLPMVEKTVSNSTVSAEKFNSAFGSVVTSSFLHEEKKATKTIKGREKSFQCFNMAAKMQWFWYSFDVWSAWLLHFSLVIYFLAIKKSPSHHLEWWKDFLISYLLQGLAQVRFQNLASRCVFQTANGFFFDLSNTFTC